MGNEENNKSNFSADLFWIKKALEKIEASQKDVTDTLRDMTRNYVTKSDLADMKKNADDIHTDHEDRIRGLEVFKTEFATKIQQWGIVAGLLFTIVNIIISKYF